MSNKVVKIGYWILCALAVIISGHYLFFQMGMLENGMAAIVDLDSDAKWNATKELSNSWTPILLLASYILIGVAAVTAIGMSLYQTFMNAISNKRNRNSLLVTFVGGAILIGVSYFAADATVPYIIGLSADDIPSPQTVKMIETSLFLTYAIFCITLLALLFGEVIKFWK